MMKSFVISIATVAALAVLPTMANADPAADTATGAAVGAGVGFAVGGPVGAAVGAGVGGTVGAANSDRDRTVVIEKERRPVVERNCVQSSSSTVCEETRR